MRWSGGLVCANLIFLVACAVPDLRTRTIPLARILLFGIPAAAVNLCSLLSIAPEELQQACGGLQGMLGALGPG